MTANKPVPNLSESRTGIPALANPETIDRLATEMRARSGSELPYSFCVEQVKRQLSVRMAGAPAANDSRPPAAGDDDRTAAVFRAWALSE
ncbi:hypothetical protein [Rhizobium sp. LCM 4573]|uniref:hypothetical protein n=1 Tax=Rhizobium sp. LCM 4573 TaxID=1848291 RepID=UPI0008DA2C19|nr:hypothetical protein [Rhizobium sp. LCM 4573]OHV84347.1 hypothetical protein LCM4573_01280 [Rhizobium sp. LCM 4573]